MINIENYYFNYITSFISRIWICEFPIGFNFREDIWVLELFLEHI